MPRRTHTRDTRPTSRVRGTTELVQRLELVELVRVRRARDCDPPSGDHWAAGMSLDELDEFIGWYVAEHDVV